MVRALGSLALILAFATAAAWGAEAPFDAATFQKLLSEGKPVAVDFHADWCPTCRAQEPLLRSITAEPEFHSLTILVANFDTETALRKSLNVSRQSTLVVFRHGKEVARSTGDTTEAGLTKLLRTAVQ
jgi:thiol-disulfide isomerase/thioredoxin